MPINVVSEDENLKNYIKERSSLSLLIKKKIIETLQLPLEEDKIDLDCPLFGSGLGLDSVDAVGLAAMIETDFNVRVLDSDISMFRSVNSIVDFILRMKKEIDVGEEAKEVSESTVVLGLKLKSKPKDDEVTTVDFQDYLAMRNLVGLVKFASPTLISIEGPDAESFVDFIVAGNVTDLPVGCLLNSIVLDDGGAISFIIWLARQDAGYLFIADKQKRQAFLTCLNNYKGRLNVEIIDKSEKNDILAVIGPRAQEMVVDIFEEDLLRLGYGEFEMLEWKKTKILIGRYGETGEFDYRFIVPSGLTETLAAEIKDSGSIYKLRFCNQEILKILMMEMKSIHPDSMLMPGCIPSQVDLQWMIDFQKEDFLGREGLLKSFSKKPPRAILLIADKESKVREGDEVWLAGGQIGFVRSVTYSLALSKWVLFAFVDDRYAWPNLDFRVRSNSRKEVSAVSRSAPLFLTLTIIESLNI